jgi:hypothetical protein
MGTVSEGRSSRCVCAPAHRSQVPVCAPHVCAGGPEPVHAAAACARSFALSAPLVRVRRAATSARGDVPNAAGGRRAGGAVRRAASSLGRVIGDRGIGAHFARIYSLLNEKSYRLVVACGPHRHPPRRAPCGAPRRVGHLCKHSGSPAPPLTTPGTPTKAGSFAPAVVSLPAARRRPAAAPDAVAAAATASTPSAT